MILRPAQEKFIEDLVPLDPLYLVDQHSDLLQPAIDAFNPGYQRRLRPYVINDWKDQEILAAIPTNQFGLRKPLTQKRQHLHRWGQHEAQLAFAG